MWYLTLFRCEQLNFIQFPGYLHFLAFFNLWLFSWTVKAKKTPTPNKETQAAIWHLRKGWKMKWWRISWPAPEERERKGVEKWRGGAVLRCCVCHCWLGKRLPHVTTRHGARGAETQTMHPSVLLRSPRSCLPRDVCRDIEPLPGTFQHLLDDFLFQQHTRFTPSRGQKLSMCFFPPSSSAAKMKDVGD